jgi:hypothetical protein
MIKIKEKMIKLDPKAEINAEVIFSNLMKRKHMVTRFRLPYTAKQVYAMLYEACRVEVAHRHREFNATEQYKKHLWDISNWITSEASTFGLFLCGDAGNGKTTILRALQNLINYLRSDEGYNSNADAYPIRGYMMVSAKELVLLAKAYNNPTRDNTSDVARYKSCAKSKYSQSTNSAPNRKKAFIMRLRNRRHGYAVFSL